MRYLSIITLLLVALSSCNDVKTKNVVEKQQIEPEATTIKPATVDTLFTSYNDVHQLIQGSWSNTLDPNSVIIFKNKTTTNKYQDIIAKNNVPYEISTNCKNEASTKSTEYFRYINTLKAPVECYYIVKLDKKTLVLELEKGDITLTFSRIDAIL
ncbi:hypothetical protein SCB49_04185 [unidentified eubacterium SCB49]|nr:hypothetical protein SCB49_04185 [unidentified eubacterium SCB49]